ncbi:unnamed protein product [Cylindrotheca closterium]|uniref:ZZ-type domain-containing protein n=1 Tax=Cylindrotheca closterium TaxID=2856 RepID=A0AAD2CK67_9STRA|nr:unnamed protein product [Cylindrotheca closterium]
MVTIPHPDTESQCVHNGISCDECGVCPIVGTRFKSRHIYDFDLCRECAILNHPQDNNAFVAFEDPVSRVQASKEGPGGINRIYAGSVEDAEQQLQEGKNAHIAFFRFYGRTPSTQECQQVVEFINKNAILTNINICLFCFQNAEQAFASIAQGLATNKHVKHLSLRLMPLWNQESFFDTSSVQHLIETNKVLETLFIGHAWLRDFDDTGSYYESEDKFAYHIFDSLKRNRTLKTFRLETISHLSAATQESACQAAATNPGLIRLFAKFDGSDHGIHMLTNFNRYRWMKRWTDLNAKPEERMKVMEEIMKSTSIDIPALYHLFRSYPQALNNL